jgi:putative phosphoribosyl transferase
VVVLGLARGGIPIGHAVATVLGVPLDVFLVRKLGVPQWPELAMGAIASGGAVVMNDSVVASVDVSPAQMRAALDRETAELVRRESAYRGGRAPADISGRTVIVVDDGIATGASMRVALRAVRALAPARLVAAVPVGPPHVDSLLPEADEVVCVVIPERFDAVGQVFADFHQINDDEVRELLNTSTQ